MRAHPSLVILAFLVFSTRVAAAAPEAPRNVAASVAGDIVTITWEPPAVGSTPLGYIVEASLVPGGPTAAAFLVIAPSIVLTAVPNGVYFVRVRSGNAEGISAASSEVTVSVPGPCTQPPDPPTGLTATMSGSLVTLTWTESHGCPATAYIVQAGSAPGSSDLAQFNVGGTTGFSASPIPGTYFVRVVAVNAFGTSAASNEVSVTVVDPGFNVTGVWHGTSDYINAPFTFTLEQSGTFVAGSYQDQKDSGGVAGKVTGSHILLDVNFGDTGIRFEGIIENTNRISGTINVPVLGRTFTFVMTR